MTKTIFAAATALALLGSAPAVAFQTTADEPPAADTPAPDGTTAEERAHTARLNAEQAAKAKAEMAAYQQAVSAVEQQIAHDQQQFAEMTAAYEAEKARLAAMSAEERLAWEADVAACKAGDTSRCALPVLPPPQ